MPAYVTTPAIPDYRYNPKDTFTILTLFVLFFNPICIFFEYYCTMFTICWFLVELIILKFCLLTKLSENSVYFYTIYITVFS